ncbi:DUF5590 domain-containing protein [Xylocopilactobacillus apis]|uniref:Cell wall elongation regulator TseB-like domain-containing protein n=1 Tax=Xylocopilactobacillus apis TaxID=2932183 RepID=A0AAU9D1Y8_9LACO|nr:DUF5590 domain-containing protein [Xylocopilactobacillus apis]BDR56300.1 hypothetical protein KIMC2_08620 [Xylocopilactobacillus apis]
MRKRSRRFPIIIGVIILILVIAFGTYILANNSFLRVKNDAIKVIQKKTDLHSFSKYYWYNHDSSYFSALGKNKENKNQYAILNTSNGNLIIVDQNKGISESEAKRIVMRDASKLKEIKNTRLGFYDHKVVWEIAYFDQTNNLNYYTLNFKNGKIVQKVLKV